MLNFFSLSSASPYTDSDFFSFFVILFHRFIAGFQFFKSGLYLDELQIAVFIALSFSGALVGSFLLLKKMTMFANAISHTILFGLVMVAFFSKNFLELDILSLIGASVITAVITGVLIRFMSDFFHVKEDAGVAFIFSFLFALSLIFLVYLSKSSHIGTELIMGSPDALTVQDLRYVLFVLGVNLVITITLFRGFLVFSFDSLFAESLGFKPSLFSYILLLQTSLSLVAAFKMVGVLLSLSFLIIPVITAKLFAKSVKQLIIWATLFGSIGAVTGTALSRHILTSFGIGLSSGGLIVLILTFLYLCIFIFKNCFSYSKIFLFNKVREN